MITLVTGPPGAGKSFYAVRRVTEALLAGKPVVTNVELREDWVEYVAKRYWPMRVNPFARRRWKREAAGRYFYSDTLTDLFGVRIRGRGEGRALMLLDEGHNWMNARSWSAEDRAEIVGFFSQHRKEGYDVDLLAQSVEMLDKQVRILFEYHVHLRNLRKARFAGLPISPVNLFLAVTTWHAAKRTVVRREVFPLTWHKNMYDSMESFATRVVGDQEDDDTVWLPRLRDELDAAGPDSRADGPRGTSAPAARLPAPPVLDLRPRNRGADVDEAEQPKGAPPLDPTGSPLAGEPYDAASLDP
jgi:hypothetical protein